MRHIFNVPLNETEREAVKKAAQISGMKMATWARQQLRVNASIALVSANQPIPFIEEFPETKLDCASEKHT